MAEAVFSYVYDFLSMVFENNDLKEKIKNVVLFGSIAKNSYDKQSDIDLFFDIKNKDEIDVIETNLKGILKSFEIKIEKTWKLKGVKLPITFIVGSLEGETWANVREEIISSGILLYGSYKEMPKNIKHYSLFCYSLKELNRKNKMKFIRKLFGYSLKKGKKEYKLKGFLEKINGLKLGMNVVLVPLEDITKIKKIFGEFKIKYKVMEVWVRL